MSNVRELKPRKPVEPPASEPSVICCPDCDCEDVTLWELEGNVIAACAECETILDLSDYKITNG